MSKISEKTLRNYARLSVVMGANVQKGQILVVNADIDTMDLTRLVVEEAYKVGASKVIVNWSDDLINRMHFEHQTVESLTDIPDWMVEQKVSPLRDGAAILHIISEVPGILGGIDAEKISKAMLARSIRFKEASDRTMADKNQWCIVAVPNVHWAKQVFPELEEEEAVDKLWEKILYAVQVTEDNDPVEVWKKHNHDLQKRQDMLNDYNFKSLHFKNRKGTDLTVELVNNHIWSGGSEFSQDGIEFTPNMPTEEIFCMPYKYGVNGTVVTTKPLDYNGTIIKEFTLTFKEGKVVEYHASNNEEVLKSLIEFDEGSSFIGEVALVPYSSPISLSNLLFYNILFDENASCHLALGRAYPMNVKGGTAMSEEELEQVGSNNSNTHVDFMFGDNEMTVIGTTHDGTEVLVLKNGDFVF